MSVEYIVYGLLFFGVLLIVEGAYFFYYDWRFGSTRVVNRRLASLARDKDDDDLIVQLRRDQERSTADYDDIPLFSSLFQKARKANIAMSPSVIILVYTILSCVIFFIISRFNAVNLIIAMAAAFLISYIVLNFWFSEKARQRIRRIEEQLPDALDIISRSLRLGHPLIFAINTVAREMPDPIAGEFALAADETAYGLSVSTALDRLSERIGSQDLRFFAMAVSIQSQSGGNLGEVIGNLSKIVRSRFLLFRKVRALTSDGRLSGWFLSLFPLGLVSVLVLLQPSYFDELIKLSSFPILAIVCAGMLIANIAFMRSVTNIAA